MPFPIGAVLGGIGLISNIVSGRKAAKQQDRQLDQQEEIAQRQQALYDQASPYYQDLLVALRKHAGLPAYRFGKQIGGIGTPGINPYSNVRDAQLGIFTNPDDRLRLLAAEENINRDARRRADQFRFGVGQRGITGSSIDAAGRAAILAAAGQQRDQFARQLALNAPGEYERRLGLLAQLLNPGLGAGSIASNIYGQQAAIAGNQAAQAGSNIGSAVGNYMYYEALRQARKQNQGRNTGTGGDINLDDFYISPGLGV